MAQKFILAGGSGFLGHALVPELAHRGGEVVVLTRNPRDCHLLNDKFAGARAVPWDGATLGPWATELDGASVVINLAGRSVNCVPTTGNQREILDSRLNAVRALGAAMAQCRCPPTVWGQCSAVGYYGNAGGGICDETAPAGRDYLAEVCRQLEDVFHALPLPTTRKIVFRLGLVLGWNGGALPALAGLTRRFLGGAAGNGRQGVSWIHLDDMKGALVQAVSDPAFRGVYNLCAPQPVTNADLMKALRRTLGRPWCPPAPAFAVRLVARWVMRTNAELFLAGRQCVPRRLLEQGFMFKHPELTAALHDLLAKG